MRVRTMLRAYAALGDTAAMDQLLARASTMRDAFAEGGGFFIRWRLHWFTDTRPLLGYPPFDRLLQPEG